MYLKIIKINCKQNQKFQFKNLAINNHNYKLISKITIKKCSNYKLKLVKLKKKFFNNKNKNKL